MSKIRIVFWTQGGNTQAMAEAIGEGVREAGKEAEVVFVSSITADELKEDPVFALGCPAMGAEVLEEGEMEPFVMEVETFAAGKKIALFGESNIDEVAAKEGTRVLGKLPLDPAYAKAADAGAFYEMENPYLDAAVDALKKI